MTHQILTHQKKVFIFFILIVNLLFLNTGIAECAQSQKIFSTIATGTQNITTGFSPKIKRKAVRSALKSSVERAVSDALTPEAFASGLETLDKTILANPLKYIVNYSVIAELRKETKYVAAVKVRVNLTLLKKHLKRYGVIKNKKEKPTVLLLISEKSDQDILLKYWWGTNPLPYESLVTNQIMQVLVDKEFGVVGEDAAKAGLKKYDITFSSIYDTASAIKLGRKLKADIVIIGKAKSFEALNRMGEEKIYEADIVLDMYHANTKKKIRRFELKATEKNYDTEEGNIGVLKKIGKAVADEIAKMANKYWEENILRKEQRIETKIEGEDYLSSFILLRKALNDIPEVKSVQTKELGEDQAMVSILFKGNAEKLAQELLLKTFDSFGIEIYDVKDKSFIIKFVSK